MDCLILACSDGRLRDVLQRLEEDLEIERSDQILVPGGPLVLARPGMERRVALGCIRTTIQGTGTRRVVLVSHQDCGAYERALGGVGFDQLELLARDLTRVRHVIENEWPALRVDAFVVPWVEEAGVPGFGAPVPIE
jgi:carbonic anhydrase